MTDVKNRSLIKKIASCALIVLSGAMYVCGWLKVSLLGFFSSSISPFQVSSFLQEMGGFSESAKTLSVTFLIYIGITGIIMIYALICTWMDYPFFKWAVPLMVALGVVAAAIFAGKYELSVTVAPFIAIAAAIAAALVVPDFDFSAEKLTRGCLTALSGTYKDWDFDIEEGETLTIGRDPSLCNIVLKDPKISRQHCAIRFDTQKQKYYVKDMSANGTYTGDGVRLQPLVDIPIDRGERIYLDSPTEMFAVK